MKETASMTAAAEASFALSAEWGLFRGVLGLAEPVRDPWALQRLPVSQQLAIHKSVDDIPSFLLPSFRPCGSRLQWFLAPSGSSSPEG